MSFSLRIIAQWMKSYLIMSNTFSLKSSQWAWRNRRGTILLSSPHSFLTSKWGSENPESFDWICMDKKTILPICQYMSQIFQHLQIFGGKQDDKRGIILPETYKSLIIWTNKIVLVCTSLWNKRCHWVWFFRSSTSKSNRMSLLNT